MSCLKWVVFCAFAAVCMQQANAQNKPVFHSIVQGALLVNSDFTSAAVQSVNGVAYKQWFAAAGAGVDLYRYISVPVFLDVRREIGNKNERPFIYVDGGINFYNDSKEENYSYKSGAYFDAGVGYLWQFKKRNTLLLSIGYCYKSFEKRFTYSSGGNEDKDDYKYGFNRLSIKAGWRF